MSAPLSGEALVTHDPLMRALRRDQPAFPDLGPLGTAAELETVLTGLLALPERRLLTLRRGLFRQAAERCWAAAVAPGALQLSLMAEAARLTAHPQRTLATGLRAGIQRALLGREPAREAPVTEAAAPAHLIVKAVSQSLAAHLLSMYAPLHEPRQVAVTPKQPGTATLRTSVVMAGCPECGGHQALCQDLDGPAKDADTVLMRAFTTLHPLSRPPEDDVFRPQGERRRPPAVYAWIPVTEEELYRTPSALWRLVRGGAGLWTGHVELAQTLTCAACAESGPALGFCLPWKEKP